MCHNPKFIARMLRLFFQSVSIKCMKHDQQVEGGDFPSLLLLHLTWSAVSSSGNNSLGKTWTYWSVSREETWRWSRVWATSPMIWDWEGWGCSAWQRIQVELLSVSQCLKWTYKKAGKKLFTGHVVIWQVGRTLNRK